MKFKKIIAVISSLAIVATLSTTVFAETSTNTESTTSSSSIESSSKFKNKVLTDEQKAEIDAQKAKMTEIKNKLSQLTDSQKEEITSLKNNCLDIQNQIIDKYVSFGVIDEATGSDIKAKISNTKDSSKDNDFKMFGLGKNFDKGSRKEKIDSNTTNSSDSKETSKTNEKLKHKDINLTEDQKAEIEANKAKVSEIKDKLSSLTEEQNSEINSLKSEILTNKNNIIDKYVEFGVIDETSADKEKTMLSENTSKTFEIDRFLMIGKEGHLKNY